MGCDSTTGLSLRFGTHSSQYSRASMLTFRWSMPSWQMSACTTVEKSAQHMSRDCT